MPKAIKAEISSYLQDRIDWDISPVDGQPLGIQLYIRETVQFVIVDRLWAMYWSLR
jgi:hypothetical protein